MQNIKTFGSQIELFLTLVSYKKSETVIIKFMLLFKNSIPTSEQHEQFRDFGFQGYGSAEVVKGGRVSVVGGGSGRDVKEQMKEINNSKITHAQRYLRSLRYIFYRI